MAIPTDALDAMTIATGFATAVNGGALAYSMWRSRLEKFPRSTDRSGRKSMDSGSCYSDNGTCVDLFSSPFADSKRRDRRATYSGATVVPQVSLDSSFHTTKLYNNGTETSDDLPPCDRVDTLPSSSGSNDDESSELTPDSNSECSDENQQKGPLHEPHLGHGIDTPKKAEDFKLKFEKMQERVMSLEKEMDPAIALEKRLSYIEDTWANRAQIVNDVLQTPNKGGSTIEIRGIKVNDTNPALIECLKATPSASTELTADACNKQIVIGREFIDLKEKYRLLEEAHKNLKSKNSDVEDELTETKAEVDLLYDQQLELQEECRDLNDDFNILNGKDVAGREAVIQLETLMQEHAATLGQLNAVCTELTETKSTLTKSMNADKNTWKEEKAALDFQVQVLKEKGRINNSDDKGSLKSRDDEIATLRARNQASKLRLSQLELQIQKGEESRRTMHNIVQALRGNIRVFVRARPLLPGDGASAETSISVKPNGQSMSILDREKIGTSFSFDKVFPPSAGQDKVFEEVSSFVQSAIDGYNVCLFSYGQTGSGKTHTMQGSGKAAMRGIIPRSVELILKQADFLQSQNWTFTIHASFLEIYNENFKDLLLEKISKGSTKLSIKKDSKGKNYVSGLTKVPIDTTDKVKGLSQLETVITTAAGSRSVAKTEMNSESSRSHSIFMLHLQGYNRDTKTTINGSLNLCDLAGSERLDRSGAGKNILRLKETQAINKSLSCLGDVFNALGKGASHVPYRNSKLTYLLQDCFSGDGKALMFVNLSPTVDSRNESLCSLKFAQRVNKVELGKPMRQMRQS